MSKPRESRSRARWALQDAKNKLSEVVDAAARGQPQVVTRRGVETAVVISYREYERITAGRRGETPTLAAYLLAMPTAPSSAGAIERIRLDARDREARYVYATSLIRLGRTDEGTHEMQLFQRLQAEDAAARSKALELGALRREGSLATAGGEHAKAVELLQRALVYDPTSASSHVDLGRALLAAGRAAEAVERLETAAALRAPIEVHVHLANAYAALGRADDAVRERTEYERLKQQSIRTRGNP